MANEIRLTRFFIKKAKRLLKKYNTLENSLKQLEQSLIVNPFLGSSYGSNIYKIRLADNSKGKGKSGGFRVITYLIKESEGTIKIYLITIFDKSEEASISKDDIEKIISEEEL